MKIWTFKGGFDENLTYLFSDGNSSETAIVDAAVPLSALKTIIFEQNLIPVKLLLTHSHFDHIAHLDDYTKLFPDMDVCISEGPHQLKNVKKLSDGDKFGIGSLKVTVLLTPGHTPDSCCFYTEEVLFSGDTVFVGRTGRTISTASDTRLLFQSIQGKVLTLPGTTKIYPGHDYGSVQTIMLQKNIEISPLLRAKDEDDFVFRMEQYEKSREKN